MEEVLEELRSSHGKLEELNKEVEEEEEERPDSYFLGQARPQITEKEEERINRLFEEAEEKQGEKLTTDEEAKSSRSDVSWQIELLGAPDEPATAQVSNTEKLRSRDPEEANEPEPS